MTEKLGPVLMFKVLWGRQVFTTEPDHVKVRTAMFMSIIIADVKAIANSMHGV